MLRGCLHSCTSGNTNFERVHDLYSEGHEIAVHTITHATGFTSGSTRWEGEINGCKLSLSKFAAIPEKEIRGFRAPFLEYGSAQLQVLQENGFEYDSSIVEYANQV